MFALLQYYYHETALKSIALKSIILLVMLSYSDFITKINILSNGRKFVLQFRDNFLFALLRVLLVGCAVKII